ncbi:MAG: L,D-transpeptidase [Lachnospiraceae bacterium]|nr:L,D-transpeptidase [Lachnospiraceae bacterium]
MAQKKKKNSAAKGKKKNTKGNASSKLSKADAAAKSGSRSKGTAKKGKNSKSGAKRSASAPKKTSAAAAKKQTSAKNTIPDKSKKTTAAKKAVISIVVIAAAVTLGILTRIYLKNAFYYKDHFFEGTVINGTDCSLMTVEEAEQTIQNTLSDYTFTFTDHEGRSSTVTAPEICVTYTDDGEVDQLMETQEYLKWAFRENDREVYNVTSGYTYSKDALDAWISALPCLNDGVPPTDAYLHEKEDTFWEIIPETYGDQLDPEIVRASITQAVDEGRPSSDLADLDCFYKPSVYSDDAELVAFVETTNAEIERQIRRNAIIEDITDVELLFSSYADKVYLNQELLKGMLEDDENGDPVISKDMVTAWVRKWAEDRGFVNETNLFVTHGGKLVYVGYGPYGGWSLDVDATAERTYEAVVNKENGVLFPVTVDGEGNRQKDSSYVEINILKQTMWYYKDGKQLVETPVVTGDPTKGMDTPTDGVWAIYQKSMYYTLRGPRYSDGTYEYITPVDYWMPFNGQIGIHDMQTRTEFGGQIYMGSGSHGCVNTPYENAEIIYQNAYVGTPVVIHS